MALLADLAEDHGRIGQDPEHYKKKLVLDVREFKQDCAEFRTDFSVMARPAPGCSPEEAVERLKRYKNELDVRERKMDMYIAGEELFALRTSKVPGDGAHEKEELVGSALWLVFRRPPVVEVNQSTLWIDVPGRLQGNDGRGQRLRPALQEDAEAPPGEWRAYEDLRAKLTDFQDLLPLISELAKPSVKPRHWKELTAQGGFTCHTTGGLPVARHLRESYIDLQRASRRDHEGADKQLGIETKLNESRETWSRTVFTFGKWKG